MDRLVTIKSSRYGMEIHFHPEAPFVEVEEALTQKLKDSARFFKGAKVALSFIGRTLTNKEENIVLDLISDLTGIEVICIIDRDGEKDWMYRSVVERTLSNIQKREGQFYRGTLSRRQVLESDSSIVILGDVELGARVIAKGSVVVVGGLYGSVHAGAAGDETAYIVALSMQPKKLIIGSVEARYQILCREDVTIHGPKIAVAEGNHIYLDPLVE